MVSDFIEEKNGYLASQEEYDKVKVNNPSIRMYAQEFLEFGKGHQNC